MIFAELPLAEAEGALLAHAITLAGRRVAKGTPVTAELVAAARAAGHVALWVARPEAGDIPEAEAAQRIGAALAGPGVVTRPPVHGRVNLHAAHAGLLLVERVAEANALTDAIGIATLPPFSPVPEGALLATAKVIPFAMRQATVDDLFDLAPLLCVRAWRSGARAAILATRLPAEAPPKAEGKAIAVTEARLRTLGIEYRAEVGIPHAPAALAQALRQTAEPLVLVAGATATADPRDVIPAAILAAGGEVVRVGMPVDPGNLLVLGRIGSRTVIGLPGCAKSPKRNGLDLVLERWAAGLDIRAVDIAGMGVGGLLEGSGAPVPWGWG